MVPAQVLLVVSVVNREDSNLRDEGAHDRSPTSSLRCKLLGQPGTCSSCAVGGAGRNMQFHFGTCIDFAPNCQLSSHNCGAFPHTG